MADERAKVRTVLHGPSCPSFDLVTTSWVEILRVVAGVEAFGNAPGYEDAVPVFRPYAKKVGFTRLGRW
jgi:hypothetical protein